MADPVNTTDVTVLTVAERAARHAALGDAVRLAIVDELLASDRAPVELRRTLGLASNLLAHHLDALEQVGLIERSRSSGDGRRRYVHLRRAALGELVRFEERRTGPALFVCTAASARSQLAAALWRQRTGCAASAAGTHPAPAVHPGARRAAARLGLDLPDHAPEALDDRLDGPMLVVTVCDRAHEALGARPGWLHWSVADPVPSGTAAAFDATVVELGQRIDALLGATRGAA